MLPQGLRCFSLPAAAAAPACCFETHLHPNFVMLLLCLCCAVCVFSLLSFKSCDDEPETTAMIR